MSKGLEALHHPRIKSAKVDISAEGKRDIAYMFFDDTKQYTAIEKELKEYEQHKAIEQELGIDLMAFSRLLYALDKECVCVKVKKTKQYNGYSIDEETGEIERKVIARFSRYANGTREWFFTISFDSISSVNHYLLKDYGKTWALTKEELESKEKEMIKSGLLTDKPQF